MPQTELKNPLDPTYLCENITDSSVNKDGKAITIQKVILVDSASNPVLDINDSNPLIVAPPNNAKYDVVSGTATGSTNTTATYKTVNQIVITPIAIVTAAASTLTVKGTTSSIILAVIALTTLAVALTIPSIIIYPTVNLLAAGETVTLTIGANYTSGTVSVNVYGN